MPGAGGAGVRGSQAALHRDRAGPQRGGGADAQHLRLGQHQRRREHPHQGHVPGVPSFSSSPGRAQEECLSSV